jgi:aryl-alcohol dehydrogenase-like predicted oxidoreductase
VLAQLLDNLGALDITIPDDAARRLDAAASFRVGFGP